VLNRRFTQCDIFTSVPTKGNRFAVVVDGGMISRYQWRRSGVRRTEDDSGNAADREARRHYQRARHCAGSHWAHGAAHEWAGLAGVGACKCARHALAADSSNLPRCDLSSASPRSLHFYARHYTYRCHRAVGGRGFLPARSSASHSLHAAV
jgi:hypothetical protein